MGYGIHRLEQLSIHFKGGFANPPQMFYTSPHFAPKPLLQILPNHLKESKSMTQLLIHKKLRLLHQEEDRDLKLKAMPELGYRYASHVNSIVLAGPEFGEAAKSYPIFFVKGKEGLTRPIALLGLNNDSNMFVDQNGQWDPYSYIPAFFRRYPFVFQENDKGVLSLCVDGEYEGLNREEGQPLFQEDGSYSDFLVDLLRFMNDYEKSMKNTEHFCERLEEWELLEPVELNLTFPTDSDQPNKIEGLQQINHERFQQLEDDKVLALFRQGSLQWLQLHLNSLSNVQLICNRLNIQKAANPA